MAERLERRRRTWRGGRPRAPGVRAGGRALLVVGVAVGVAVLLLFPIIARLWAGALPVAPATGPALPALVGGRSGQVHDLPEFVTMTPDQVSRIVGGGVRAEAREIGRLARASFGLRGERLIARAVAVSVGSPLARLPFVAASRLGDENDLAALLIEAAAISEPTGAQLNRSDRYADAGPVALALLRDAGRDESCAPQLNEAFLLASASPYAEPNLTQRAYRRAVAACPDDPTALWALGQYESVQIDPSAAAATFATLVRRFPPVSAGWSGYGDNVMRIGYSLQDNGEPFAARRQYALALALYRRADALAPGSGPRSGIGRALAALDQPGAAVAVQRRALAGRTDSADLEARLLDYLQRAHEFTAAVAVATRMETLARFPAGPALFAEPPTPDGYSTTVLGSEDANEPMSTGAGTMAPVEVTLEQVHALVSPSVSSYLSYLPLYLPMGGIGGLARWCPEFSRLTDLLLSGHPATLLANLSGAGNDLRGTRSNDCGTEPPDDYDQMLGSVDVQELAGVAELELGNVAKARAFGKADASPSGPSSLSYLEELRQNLWRYAGNYTHAALAAAQWATQLPGDRQAVIEEGQIAFLRHRYDEAATDFAVADNDAQYASAAASDGQALALLDEGTALEYAGHRAEALTTLTSAGDTGIRSYVASGGANGTSNGAAYATFAQEQSADLLLNSNDLVDAARGYATAASSMQRANLSGPGTYPAGSGMVGPSVLDNNYAIAELAVGDPAMAATLARSSIGDDPGDAIFWWTEGDAQRELGHRDRAIADYRAAVQRDPTEFPAANNLGVLLLDAGQTGAAVSALRRSVGAAPGYATGWFNLGIALGRQGPLHLLASEGSLARADQLNPALAKRAPNPFFDNSVYISHLDLSKPLPAKWTFANSQIQSPLAAAGLSTILVMALTLARSLAARGGQSNAQKWLSTFERYERKLERTVPGGPLLALVATVVLLLWPLHSGPEAGWAFGTPYAIGLTILVMIVLGVRRLAAAGTHTAMREETWLPGVALGLGLAIVGLSWAPLPVLRAPGNATRLHWAAPTAAGALALALLLLATWLDVPVARNLGAAALVMTASLLTPVKPLDGATISAASAGTLPSIAVLGTAVLLLLGLL
ncbi:MAG: tetratricopeptide repeat protein [Solirubrobacteraceae bacterium]